MAKLTFAQRQDRLKFDFLVVTNMVSPIMNVAAYRNLEDMKARRNPIISRDEGAFANHYIADYQIKTLIGEDQYSSNTLVHFDLLAEGDYPFSEPKCWVLSNEMPWTPHFLKGRPICTGEIWAEAKGRMLLGQLLIHIAKLLNFDEIPRSPNYNGYNGAAVRYWKNKLNMQPLTPNLVYPVLPDIDRLLISGDGGFTPKTQSLSALGIFQSKPSTQPAEAAFQAKRTNVPVGSFEAAPLSSPFKSRGRRDL